MDLPLWEPCDDQGHLMLFDRSYHIGDSCLFDPCSGYGAVNNQSSYCTGDGWLSGLYFWRDGIEEDALNEKYCVEVLRILVDKADEDIVKLEADIVMLQCQLAWDDEDWSKLCSAAIREKIDHLDDVIQILKMANMEGVHCFDVELEQLVKPPPRLHDLLKPLLENYFSAKIKQTTGGITQISVQCTVDLSEKILGATTSKPNNKLGEKEWINPQKKERKSLVVQPEDKRIYIPQQKKDTIIGKCISDAYKCAYYKLSENDLNKLNRLQRKRMPIFAPAKSGWKSFKKSEPSNQMTKNSSNCTSTDKGNVREMSKSNKIAKEVFHVEKNTKCRPQHESTVMNSHLKSQESEKRITETMKSADVILGTPLWHVKQIAEASSKTPKARTNGYVINENILFSKPWVTMKRKRTKVSERSGAVEARLTERKDTSSDSLSGLLNDRSKHSGKPKMKVEPKFELQQICEVKNLFFNQAKSISSLKPEGRGKVEQLSLEEEVHMGSPSSETLRGQQNSRVRKKFRMSSKTETQQESSGVEIDGGSENTIASISSSRKKTKSSFTSQNTRPKRGARNFLMKLENLDDDIPNSPVEEATDNCAVKESPQISPLCIKDGDTLSLNDLKAIAKNHKLPGYYKLRKAELQKRLGLQLQKAYEKKGQDSLLQI